VSNRPRERVQIAIAGVELDVEPDQSIVLLGDHVTHSQLAVGDPGADRAGANQRDERSFRQKLAVDEDLEQNKRDQLRENDGDRGDSADRADVPAQLRRRHLRRRVAQWRRPVHG
jgi:hypothetical protein